MTGVGRLGRRPTTEEMRGHAKRRWSFRRKLLSGDTSCGIHHGIYLGIRPVLCGYILWDTSWDMSWDISCPLGIHPVGYIMGSILGYILSSADTSCEIHHRIYLGIHPLLCGYILWTATSTRQRYGTAAQCSVTVMKRSPGANSHGSRGLPARPACTAQRHAAIG